MAVRPVDLENPERGAPPLTSRAPQGGGPGDEEPRKRGVAAAKDRLAAARALPAPETVRCKRCWRSGRDAALAGVAAAIEGATTTKAIAEAVEAARGVEPPVRAARSSTRRRREESCCDVLCWQAGVAAALDVVEGKAG